MIMLFVTVPLASRVLTHETLCLETPLDRQNNALCLVNLNRYTDDRDVIIPKPANNDDDENEDDDNNDDDGLYHVGKDAKLGTLPLVRDATIREFATFDVVSSRFVLHKLLHC
jgi:hypothetical protein